MDTNIRRRIIDLQPSFFLSLSSFFCFCCLRFLALALLFFIFLCPCVPVCDSTASKLKGKLSA